MAKSKIDWTTDEIAELRNLIISLITVGCLDKENGDRLTELISKALHAVENTIRAIDGIDALISLQTDEIFIKELKAIKETLEYSE